MPQRLQIITFPFFVKQVSCKTKTDEEIIEFTYPEHIQQPLIENCGLFQGKPSY